MNELGGSVFKFMSGEQYHLDALRDAHVFFSDFMDLNDPYEGLLNFCKEGVDDSLRMAVFANGIALQNSTTLAQGRKFADRFLKKYGTEAMRKHVDIITESIFDDFRVKHLKSRFVLSLALQLENHKFPAPLTNMMMWSHYAKGMRGMCIEYDYQGLLNSIEACNKGIQISTRRVTYSRSKLPIVRATTLMQSYIKDEGKAGIEMIDAFCTKANAWQYENEIRFLSSHHGLVSFDSSSIKRIFISHRSPELAQQVKEIVKYAGTNVPLFIVSSKPDTYGFGFREYEI